MKVEDRFLKYVKFASASDENSKTSPSTSEQLEIGAFIANEMKQIGLKNVKQDKHGYVYGFLPANVKNSQSIGLISHMDVSPSAPSQNIKTKIIKYNGGDIQLNKDIVTDVKSYPFLKNYIGQKLIVTDGKTLLGADDKAGIAEILTAMEYLIAHPEIKHGKICIGITPDEEIGRGTDFFNLKLFDADYAYTIDGGRLGELQYENFNAAGIKLKINGLNVHPGSAKNIMKNAILIANELLAMLPPAEIPAKTANYEGFYHVQTISGNESETNISMLIRDHDMKKFKQRKQFVESIVKKLNKKYGQNTIELSMKDSYYNMKKKIEPNMFIVEKAKKAMKEAKVKPIIKPIRGGTDGAMLSFKGLPCPNLSTGGENFHGIHEFVSIDAMHKMTEIIVNLITI